MNLEKDLVWKDIRTDGYPKEGEQVVVDTHGMYTGTVEYNKALPPAAKFSFDRQHILNDTRYAYVSEEEMDKIRKEYW